MRKRQLGFFTRIILSLIDFRIYPFTQKEKITTALGYFIKLTFLASFILSFGFVWFAYDSSVVILEEIQKNMPDFYISDNVLTSTANNSGELLENVYYILDDDKTSADIGQMLESSPAKYDYFCFVLKDKTSFHALINDEYAKAFEIDYKQFDENVTKADLINEWKNANESYLFRLAVIIGIAIGFFGVYALYRAWGTLLNIVCAHIISFVFGLKLKFSGYLKLVIYAMTLSTILEVFSLLVAHKLPDSAMIIVSLLTFIYIFYGLKTIKIEELIMAGEGNSPEERIKDALAKAQKELKSQLDEMEKKDKEEASKRNQNDSNIDASKDEHTDSDKDENNSDNDKDN